MEHMVDSYEIYGENQPVSSNDSDFEVPRPKAPLKKMEEHVIEPNKMMKSDKRSSGVNQGRKQSGQSKDRRDSSGVKKTQIEILDHETPIEQYQQYYHQMQEGGPQQELQPHPVNSQL